MPTRLPPGSVVFAAHPDDETIGAAALLARSEDCWVTHLTDGAPAQAIYRALGGDVTAEGYAQLRRSEACDALAHVRIPSRRILRLRAKDLEAVFSIVASVQRWIRILDVLRPPLVLVHPYEGGHPDHDAVAFVAHAARALGAGPEIWEMTSYHGKGGAFVSGSFLDARGEDTWTLSADERALKTRMFEAYVSQRHVLSQFQLAHERFRPAPRYAFGKPPHAGTLYYEARNWFSGVQWRRLATAAMKALGISEASWVSPS